MRSSPSWTATRGPIYASCSARGPRRWRAMPPPSCARRSSASSPPAATCGRSTGSWRLRRTNVRRVIRNFSLLAQELGDNDRQLASFVDSSNANFQAFANQEASLRRSLRLLPETLDRTERTLTSVDGLARQMRPALTKLRPGARALGPALRASRPFLRSTTPVIRDQIRPFSRDVRPTIRDLRPAARDLAASAPGLTNTFGVLNKLFNALAYNPPGPEEGFQFWASWGAHNGASLFSIQDAHGPARRGPGARILLRPRDPRAAPGGQPAPRHGGRAAEHPRPHAGLPRRRRDLREGEARPMIKERPSIGRLTAMVLFAFSCVGDPALPVADVRRLGAAALGGLPVRGQVPRGHPAGPGGRRPHLRGQRGQGAREDPGRADRADQRRARAGLRVRAGAQGHEGDPAPEDAARRDLCRADARPTQLRRAGRRRHAGPRPGVAHGGAGRDLPRVRSKDAAGIPDVDGGAGSRCGRARQAAEPRAGLPDPVRP